MLTHARSKLMLKSALALSLALFCALSWGQAYKWRDANGRIQYSDTPPPPGAREVQQLRPSPPGASPPATSRPSYSEQDAAFRKRLVEKREAEASAAKAAEDEKVRVRNCEQARGQLAGIDSGQRMVQLNAAGERIALDDEERKQARADAVKAIETWCKP
jgi:hypothetical protein